MIFCTTIHASQRMNLTDGGDPLTDTATIRVYICGFDLNVSTVIGWIVLKFGTHIQAPLRMKCSNFGDPLTFHVPPPSDQNLHLPDTLV